MKFYIIIPAHNEDKTIGLTLNSLVNQTKHPKKIVVVNDNSDDNTEKIISQFCKKYNWIQTVNLFWEIRERLLLDKRYPNSIL